MKPGNILADHLHLVRLLGRGASSAVWLAEDLDEQGEQLAVKVMHAAAANNPSSIMRFVQEAQAAAQIEHPNVARVREHGVSDEGDRFIVMEWLEGETLRERLERTGPLPLALAADVIRQIADGLVAAHARGIIHRDIKPANVFLVPQGEGGVCAKILDFGVAKLTGEEAVQLTSDGALLGTPAYMSPEQFRSGTLVDRRSDLWSLGVVAYRVLTGVLPFDGDSVGAVCLAVERAEYTPVSQLRPELSGAVDSWFARAFEHDRQRRFDAAEEMAAALSTALSSPASTDEPPAVATLQDGHAPFGQGYEITKTTSSSRLIDTSEPLDAEPNAADPPLDAPSPKDTSLHALMRAPETPARPSRWLRLGAAAAVVGLLAAGSWVALSPADRGASPAHSPGANAATGTEQAAPTHTEAAPPATAQPPAPVASETHPHPTPSSALAHTGVAPSIVARPPPGRAPQPASTAQPAASETTAPQPPASSPQPKPNVDERTQQAAEKLGI